MPTAIIKGVLVTGTVEEINQLIKLQNSKVTSAGTSQPYSYSPNNDVEAARQLGQNPGSPTTGITI